MLHVLIYTVIAIVVAAQPCPQQQFRHLDDVDVNQVADDPVSGQKLLVQLVSAKVGQTVTVNGKACDDDGDPLTAWADDPDVPVAIDVNDGTFSFQVQRDTPGIEYVTIGLTDGIDLRMGTYAVQFRTNTPPILAALPPAGGTEVSHLRQKSLMILSKAFGRPVRRGLVLREE